MNDFSSSCELPEETAARGQMLLTGGIHLHVDMTIFLPDYKKGPQSECYDESDVVLCVKLAQELLLLLSKIRNRVMKFAKTIYFDK